ncbi:MAG: InlB B-repeat-containing protein, partial [Erysipelotrichaceae bacterium]|nr:InlB B-repeat-containing protein [Erysipelotrichaceae bacterium]
MAKYKCKMCGAPLEVCEGQTVVTCEFCQSKQTVANANDERKENLFNRANALRAACDFDKAILSYQSILSIFPDEPEAHWGVCLCKYGIEYVDDPATHNKIPTIHRVSYDSILKDSDYISALAYSDVIAKEEYLQEAKQIADIQRNILSISQKEEPFDIFICYKETSEAGKRTPDSVLAQEIYTNLTDRGYKVFFSRITLESKLGSLYEPYIFAALNSAKIMLVIGTKKEYFEAVWVRNEWSRFIDLMKTRPDHYLIPCYRGIDAYEMPEEFLSFQGQDMGKLGFIQDLTRGIDKIMGRTETPKATIQAETKIIQTDVNIAALLKRAEIFIGDEEWNKADETLERVLDNDPTNSDAYLYKMLIDYKVHSVSELEELDDLIDINGNYKKAYNFGNSEQKARVTAINDSIKNKLEHNRLEGEYNKALLLKSNGNYLGASEIFSSISSYLDSLSQSEECINLEKEDKYYHATKLKETGSYKDAIGIFESLDYQDSAFQVEECIRLEKEDRYNQAIELKECGIYSKAIDIFLSLNFNDSEFQVSECRRLIEESKKEAIYKSCVCNLNIRSNYEKTKMEKACIELSKIRGYKDVDRLLVSYENAISEFNERLKKQAEEFKRARAIRTKKIKKASFFTIISALGLTAVLLLTTLVFVPSGRQSKIIKALDSKDYYTAYTLLKKNGGFGDTDKLCAMYKAGQSFEQQDYESGIEYVCSGASGIVNISYDTNGGTASKTSETIQPKKKYINNYPKKDGYTFSKWEVTNYSLNSKKYNASIDLKAKYSLTTYSITYNLNGGSVSSNPTTYTINDSITLNNPTKNGYTFTGWSGTDISGLSTNVAFSNATGDRTYTANWNGNSYTVTLDPNGGSVSQTTIGVTYGSTYTLPTPTKEGYA